MKAGLVTLVGRSNVGKSSLLNTLVGTKLAAVTPKPQTTRHTIHGVLNHAEGQAVFIDTPGIFKGRRIPLAGPLTDRVREALKNIDLVLYVVDPTKPLGAEERYSLALLRTVTAPKILVINKSDLPPRTKIFLADYQALAPEFTAVLAVSARRHTHIQPLVEKVFALLPEGELLYPAEQLTNINREFWVAEIIREKIFLALRKEVPYSTHVEVESIEEKPELFVINARVLTNDKRYKEMIIGRGGRAIKEIGSGARRELEAALNKKVYLELEVEVDRHWMERI